MTLLAVILIAALTMGSSGLLTLLLRTGPGVRDRFFATLMGAGGVVGALAVLWSLAAGTEATYHSAWMIAQTTLSFRLDAISAVFLLPVFMIPSLGAIFGTAYWRESHHGAAAARLRVFYALMPMSMAGVILAQDGILLLLSWEIMAISAFMAVATEDKKPEVRQAAWVYLASAHVGTLALFGFFTLLSSTTGSFELSPLARGAAPAGVLNALFLLALVGFGLKAGIMPLHVWLPGAHANAPSHVSAILSGVMLNTGVYGLVRATWILPASPAWCSWTLIGVGACSAVLGIAFSLAQRDYKRLLAYSSIENIGIIVLALGVAMLGRHSGNTTLAALGLAGAMLHTWNHSLFKSLLFFVSGALLHATGTRRINALGGLARRMPLTAAMAAVACASIAALPPLNGFVSEWLIYTGMVGTLKEQGGSAPPHAPLALAVVAMALTGALALASFAKFFGTIFLGQERTAATEPAHDPPVPMLWPMAALVVPCVIIGAAPGAVLPLLERAVLTWTGDAAGIAATRAAVAIPATMSIVSGGAALIAIAVFAWLRSRVRASDAPRVGTWDCAYARPSSRMQYTESSFAEPLLALFATILRPRRKPARVEGPFPTAASFESDTPDVVLDRGIIPLVARAARWILRLRLLQQGRVQYYILSILIGLLVLLFFGCSASRP